MTTGTRAACAAANTDDDNIGCTLWTCTTSGRFCAMSRRISAAALRDQRLRAASVAADWSAEEGRYDVTVTPARSSASISRATWTFSPVPASAEYRLCATRTCMPALGRRLAVTTRDRRP